MVDKKIRGRGDRKRDRRGKQLDSCTKTVCYVASRRELSREKYCRYAFAYTCGVGESPTNQNFRILIGCNHASQTLSQTTISQNKVCATGSLKQQERGFMNVQRILNC